MSVPTDADGVQRPLFIKRLKNGANDSLSVDGSITPVVFTLAPPANQIWRVSRWMISIQDEKGFDVGTFGSNGTLTNGIMPRIKQGSVTNDILEFGIKSNGDIASAAYDMTLHTFGNTDDTLVAQLSFTKMGQFIRLDGSVGDELQVVVNDDLTSVNKIHILAQGYIEK